jgi:hypothetical protein
MLSGALQRNATHVARLSNISVYFCANVAEMIRDSSLRSDDIDQITNERRRRGYRQTIDIALADAASCSGRELDYFRDSLADRTKSAAA